ncbi:MBL fold metallo-hydrolase [Fulvivirga lutimaris]|uniref:MBL fold metallo-hydrolase n=1 Tax=Fulvivirga lutimaris TaxID=1819566 RepID=UPI0012BBACB9|nr:MBL fold metallo-hydrolase [Fulvivirga lutimaris]MTI40823.1 MBL fold metallo-hydrolase [Fulvivirga lutimaris]
MIKTVFVSLILICCTFTVSPGQVSFDRLSDNVFHINADDDKTSVKSLLIVKNNNGVLVDAMYGEYGKSIKSYLDKNDIVLEYIINTHYHGDHTQGNSNFDNTTIIAHQNTLSNIENKAQYGPEEPFDKEYWPNLLITDSLLLSFEGIEINIFHLGKGHTNGDAIVHIPEFNLVDLGDIILAPEALPYASDPKNLISVLDAISEKINEQTIIVTGHGALANKSDLHALVKIMKDTIDYVQGGKDITSFPAEWNSWNSQFIDMPTWLGMLTKYYKK